MSAKTGNRLTEKANAAFRQAAAKVVERARQTGTPVIVWEKGQVAEHSGEKLKGLDSQGQVGHARIRARGRSERKPLPSGYRDHGQAHQRTADPAGTGSQTL